MSSIGWVGHKSLEEIPGIVLAWIAGFFDGEGNISVCRGRKSTQYLLGIRITNTHRASLLYVQQWLGGKVSRSRQRGPRWKPVQVWAADAALAERALRALLPYLLVKKERAELALEFRRLFKGCNILPRGNHKSPKKFARIIAIRETYYQKFKELNRRGP